MGIGVGVCVCRCRWRRVCGYERMRVGGLRHGCGRRQRRRGVGVGMRVSAASPGR